MNGREVLRRSEDVFLSRRQQIYLTNRHRMSQPKMNFGIRLTCGQEVETPRLRITTRLADSGHGLAAPSQLDRLLRGDKRMTPRLSRPDP